MIELKPIRRPLATGVGAVQDRVNVEGTGGFLCEPYAVVANTQTQILRLAALDMC